MSKLIHFDLGRRNIPCGKGGNAVSTQDASRVTCAECLKKMANLGQSDKPAHYATVLP
jgi:hypothetical protein